MKGNATQTNRERKREAFKRRKEAIEREYVEYLQHGPEKNPRSTELEFNAWLLGDDDSWLDELSFDELYEVNCRVSCMYLKIRQKLGQVGQRLKPYLV